MATTFTPDHARAGVTSRSFTPPGNRMLRLSHLDPRPLWHDSEAVESAWRSPTFWAAYCLVAPLAALAKLRNR